MEVVVALEARAETINGLAGLANPESDGVYGFAQGPHISAFSVTERLNSLGFAAFIRLRFQAQLCVRWGREENDTVARSTVVG